MHTCAYTSTSTHFRMNKKKITYVHVWLSVSQQLVESRPYLKQSLNICNTLFSRHICIEESFIVSIEARTFRIRYSICALDHAFMTFIN